jgi:hypothetical protein
MSAAVQTIAVIVIAALALGFVIFRVVRRARGKKPPCCR